VFTARYGLDLHIISIIHEPPFMIPYAKHHQQLHIHICKFTVLQSPQPPTYLHQTHISAPSAVGCVYHNESPPMQFNLDIIVLENKVLKTKVPNPYFPCSRVPEDKPTSDISHLSSSRTYHNTIGHLSEWSRPLVEKSTAFGQ